jgi:hypothetical protein
MTRAIVKPPPSPEWLAKWTAYVEEAIRRDYSLPMEWALAGADLDYLVEPAIRNGDWDFLEWFVRNGGPIDVGNLRAYIADVLKGDKKRPKDSKRRAERPPAAKTRYKYYLIAKHYEVLRSTCIKGVEGRVMEQFDVERSTVDRAKKAYGARVKYVLEIMAANGWPIILAPC